MSVRVFINYRRADSEGYAGWLRKDLAGRFGTAHVFMDVVGIEPGLDFVDEINRQVAACDVFLSLIGPDWLSPRLQKANDFVRLEIEAALDRGIRLIPLLVGGATMPEAEELPPSLAALARRNAFVLTSAGWDDQVRRLCDVIDRARAPVAPTAATAEPERRDETPDVILSPSPVERLAFLPEGRRIAAAGAGFLRVWPIAPGGPTFTSAYGGAVNALAASPDGRLVATAHNDGTAVVWSASNGDVVLTVKRAKRVNDVAFSPDGNLLATAHADRTARIWEIGSGMEHAPLRHDTVVYAVAFSEDPSRLWTATGRLGQAPLGGSARLWDHWNGEVLEEFGYGRDGGFFTGARFSTDGGRLAVTASGDVALVFEGDVAAGEIPGVGYGQTVAFGPDGLLAVAWIGGGALVLGADGQETRLGGEEQVAALALDPTGTLAATAAAKGPIRLWPLT